MKTAILILITLGLGGCTLVVDTTRLPKFLLAARWMGPTKMKTIIAIFFILSGCAQPLPAAKSVRYDCDGKFNPDTGLDIR